jgi:hypothetical protein
MNSYVSSKRLSKTKTPPIWATCMADVVANLSDADQEIQSGHPFLGAKASLTSEVVKMRHEALKQVCQTLVWTLGVDGYGVLGDVFDV